MPAKNSTASGPLAIETTAAQEQTHHPFPFDSGGLAIRQNNPEVGGRLALAWPSSGMSQKQSCGSGSVGSKGNPQSVPRESQSVGTKPRAPIQHRRSADAEDGRDVTIRHAVTSHEQDLGAGNDAIGRAFTARPLRQDVAIRVAQRQRCSRIVHTRRYNHPAPQM